MFTSEGKLKNYINPHAGKDHVVMERTLSIIYAAIHRFGAKTDRDHKANITTRPFLVVQDDDLKEISIPFS